MEILIRMIILVTVISMTSSCSQIRSPQPSVEDSQTQTGQSISLGSFKNTEDQIISLDDPKYDGVVLIFASDTCSTCAEEAIYWKNELNNGLPNNILFLHYLLGGFKDDAFNWKQNFKLNWNVLYNEDDDLYRRYCPAIITPCLLIYNKNLNQLTQTYKPLRKQEIENLTGAWK